MFVLTVCLMVLTVTVRSQSVLKGDYMEDYSEWRGISTSVLNAGFIGQFSAAVDSPAAAPMFVSSDSSYFIKGTGTGSSAIESDTLNYPNLVGLLPSNQYQIRFRLAAFGLSMSSYATAGLDAADYMQMEYSTDNGSSWFKDVRVSGFSNATWGYSGNNGTSVNITKNATLSTTTPVTYQSTTANPVTGVSVTLPAGASQLRLRFYFQVNANGESWLMDNVEVWDMGAPLPVDLVSFHCKEQSGVRLIEWVVASQRDNDHFLLSSSADGMNYGTVGIITGAGTCNELRTYRFSDSTRCEGVVYYKLQQVDFDGKTSEFGPIAAYCARRRSEDAEYFNLLGQQQRPGDRPSAVFQVDK